MRAPEGSTLANDDDFVIWARIQGAPEQDTRTLTGVGAELGERPCEEEKWFLSQGKGVHLLSVSISKQGGGRRSHPACKEEQTCIGVWVWMTLRLVLQTLPLNLPPATHPSILG